MVFTARNRQNPFAKRRREQAEAEKVATAAPAASPEPPAPKPVQMAAPFDRNPESEEYEQAPDISTYTAGGVVPQTTVEDVVIGERGTETVVPLSHISADTQAKIEAVMNHAIPPVAEPEHVTAAEFIATMSGPGHAPSVEPQSAPEGEHKRGRGRPRPQETIDRDNAVHALLVGADAETGISKESIAAELKEKEQQVYSSLRQLSKEGRAETRYVKPHGYRWFAV